MRSDRILLTIRFAFANDRVLRSPWNRALRGKNMVDEDGQSPEITLIGVEKSKDGYLSYRIPLDRSFIEPITESVVASITATNTVTDQFDPDGDTEKTPFKAKSASDDIWDSAFMDSIDDYLNLPALDHSDFGAKKFFATVIVFRNDSGTWMLINKRDVERVGRRGFMGRFSEENRVTKIEYPVYIFSDKYHVIEHNDIFYVNNYNSFDALFRSPDDLKPKVTKMTERLSSVLTLTKGSADALIEIASRKKSIAKKLDSLNRHIDNIKPTPEKIKNALAILKRNVDDYFVEDDLSFTEENTEALLHILNEDLFRGLISGITYTADKKSADD